MEYIIKIIKSIENRGILLKETFQKVINQQGGFRDNFFGPLMTVGFPLIKSVFTSLAKSVLIPLGLMAATSTIDTAIQKKIYQSGMIN